MIVKSPKLVLTCVAVAALALPAANAAAQPRTSEVRIQELINEAARIAASGQVATPTTAQQGGQTTAPAAGPRVSLTLEDAGHFPHVSDQARFLSVIRDFLATTVPARYSPVEWRDAIRRGRPETPT